MQTTPLGRFRVNGQTNSVWILLPMLGLFVSVRLILDGSYGLLGH